MADNTRSVVYLRDIPWDEGTPQTEVDLLCAVLVREGINPNFLGHESAGMPIPPTFLDDAIPVPDIVVVDYGGMSIMGAHDGALSCVRYILRWADNHPSSVIIIWTRFTQFLVDEVYDAAKGAPANVFVYQTGHEELAWPAIRQYLGIQEPTDEPD